MSSPTSAGTVTGNNVTNTHSTTRTWQARITYSNITDNATTYSMSLVGNWYCSNASTSSYTAFAAGKLSASMSGGVSGSWTNSSKVNWPGKTPENLISKPFSVNKSHTTQSFSVTFSITAASSSDWKGTSTVTLPITVSPKPSYAVAYHANGGSGAPSSQTKWYGETLTLWSTIPTRSGYSFWHWNTASDNTGTSFGSGAAFTGNYGMTLYAIWNPIIYYNGNGATGGSTASQTKTYNTNITLRSNGFTRPGYSFWHWNTASNNTGTTYNAGATYTSNSTATLYAIWNPIIYYNANGGTGAPGSQTKTYNTNLTLSTVKPTRSGYDFVCWNTNASGTGTNYYPGGTYTSNSTATLYAIWKRKPVYVKKDGAWKSGVPYVKVNGTWHENTGVFVKRNGTWVPL